jgi:flavin reductase (DIM6/NTAB) family NADH-FMN oxidoreductase RutF
MHALGAECGWQQDADRRLRVRCLAESEEGLRSDSRWPAFFPSSLCFISTSHGSKTALEKVVGASIVNRFPYTVAISLCRTELSARHYARRQFMSLLESSGRAVLQFIDPGPDLIRLLAACADVPDSRCDSRLAYAGLSTRSAMSAPVPVVSTAYLVYEGRLVEPSRDFAGHAIHATPWIDVGSHRTYFLEIQTLQLSDDVAREASRIHWRSLPSWAPRLPLQRETSSAPGDRPAAGYQKPYTPHYVFPSAKTTAFEGDVVENGMAVKRLPARAADQVERDNDRARWPCFFPSSVGMITTWSEHGEPNVMPCGSTSVVSRHPFVIAPCVGYAAINRRYAPRGTLDAIRRRGWFGCGVPFVHETIVEAIRRAGNTSIRDDLEKVRHAGLEAASEPAAPYVAALPVHFECKVVGEVRLGTHIMFLGEVRRILVREDVVPDNPLRWCPWPTLVTTGESQGAPPPVSVNESVRETHVCFT